MTGFTPLSGLAGGILIGLASVIMLLGAGRITGISGIFGGLLSPARDDFAWRGAFIVGLIVGGLLWPVLNGEALPINLQASWPVLLAAGLLVGFGTRLGGGSITLEPIHTPGHTDGHFAYRLGDRVFTGDALLIEGCGRTDFQNGDADSLYRSVHERLFTLPDDYLVYPAHDYKKRRVSTIAQEKDRNARLGNDKTLEEFRKIMQELNLPYPKFIDYAVPGNRRCGVCPDDLPEQLQEYCRQMEESPQG